MCKIGILLLDRDFEHDIYELIKAFYPEGDIHSLYEKDEAVYDIFFTVKKDNDNFVKYNNVIYYRTGDLGFLDENNYLFVTGRLKEIIKIKGKNISPYEIENCLLDSKYKDIINNTAIITTNLIMFAKSIFYHHLNNTINWNILQY